MTRHARILPAATGDLDEIVLYLRNDSISVSDRFVRAMDQVVQRLLEAPLIGRQRDSANERMKGLRSWPIPGFSNYLVFYRPLPDGIEVVRVLHGARDLASILGDE